MAKDETRLTPTDRESDRLRRELAETVRRYRAHNDAFERSLNALHAKWLTTGLIKEPKR